jgi:hypothetical protein
MPKVNKVINSFNAGELSGKMDARIDQEKYAFGARTMENFTPLIYGGAERRPGTEYVATQNSSSAKGRVVAFEHSVDDTYILLFENQRMQVFTGGTSPSAVFKPYGTEDLSALSSNIIAHYKCDDNAANTTVLDDDGNTHDAAASANTTNLTASDAAGNANAAFDLADKTYYFTITDHNDFSFGDGTNDSPFSIAMWVRWEDDATEQTLLHKESGGEDEYEIVVTAAGAIKVTLHDDSSSGTYIHSTSDVMTEGWHFIVITYSGVGGTGAASEFYFNESKGINVYVDWTLYNATSTNRDTLTNYTSMENLTSDVLVGANIAGNADWVGDMDNIAFFDKELTRAEIAVLKGTDSTTPYSISTPYLTADIPFLKFERSADVMYITHPSYEPRKLSRYSDTMWILEPSRLQTGPFRDENAITTKTITPSATTGYITLTAVGHSPFVDGTTAGHEASASSAKSTHKTHTGALIKLVHATSTPSVAGALDSGTLNNTHTALAIPKGVTWDFTTNGTWGTAADSASVVLERSYDSGTTYETVVTVTSAANKNIDTSGTEDFADAVYRARVSEAGGDNSICSTQLSVRDTSHIGIAEIWSVTSPQTASAVVRKTLGGTAATHRWSEGSFSNYRGWPIDVTISAEERLTFTGNATQPLTTWSSKVGDFTDYSGGTDDDDAITFSLVGTGRQNRIRWVIPKDALIIGTVGGVHLLGASKVDEALTPTNVRARLQTTKGSEDVAAIMINQAVLFAERGGRKIRELLFDFNSDSYKADDLTVFAEHIMGTGTTDGVVDMAYQRTPDPMLWCVRNDGQMAVMSYERDQKVFAWSRFVTEDSTSDSSFESVAVIYGGARSEDEVWVTVKRTVNSSTVRYVERFKSRNWGTDDEDAFFVDSGFTYDSTATSTITTGLDHLVGETVQILGDGVVFDTDVVDGSGDIDLKINGVTTTASTIQIGLGYTSTLKPMKLNIEGQGRAATYKILEGVLSLYKTMRGEWGSSTSNLNPLKYRKAGQTSAEFPMTTDDIIMEFEGGHSRSGDVIVRQTDPVPMTVLALSLDVQVEGD